MLLHDAQKLARKLMDSNGLQDWALAFDTGTRRFGACWYNQRKITLSKELVRINHHDAVKDTILHEIAHAMLPEYCGHNSTWRATAQAIGGSGKAKYSANDAILAQKYKATCDCTTHYTNRRKQGTCGSCGVRVVWTKNEQPTIKR